MKNEIFTEVLTCVEAQFVLESSLGWVVEDKRG